jgi:hypothetical protein
VEELLVFEPGDRSLFFKSLALAKGDIEAEEPEVDRCGASRRFGTLCATLIEGLADGGVGIGPA